VSPRHGPDSEQQRRDQTPRVSTKPCAAVKRHSAKPARHDRQNELPARIHWPIVLESLSFFAGECGKPRHSNRHWVSPDPDPVMTFQTGGISTSDSVRPADARLRSWRCAARAVRQPRVVGALDARQSGRADRSESPSCHAVQHERRGRLAAAPRTRRRVGPGRRRADRRTRARVRSSLRRFGERRSVLAETEHHLGDGTDSAIGLSAAAAARAAVGRQSPVTPAPLVSRIRGSVTDSPERGARIARRDDREYREYSREEQRSEAGCPARNMSANL
jgi:hypothetical protein